MGEQERLQFRRGVLVGAGIVACLWVIFGRRRSKRVHLVAL
jgi:hypothetical protein